MGSSKGFSCGSCAHSDKEAMPGQLQRVLVCRLRPPTPIGVATPQGIAVQFVSTVVQESNFCSFWKNRECSEEKENG